MEFFWEWGEIKEKSDPLAYGKWTGFRWLFRCLKIKYDGGSRLGLIV